MHVSCILECLEFDTILSRTSLILFWLYYILLKDFLRDSRRLHLLEVGQESQGAYEFPLPHRKLRPFLRCWFIKVFSCCVLQPYTLEYMYKVDERPSRLLLLFKNIIAHIAQLAVQRFCKPQVGSSNLSVGTKFCSLHLAVRISPFHGGYTSSNLVGNAKFLLWIFWDWNIKVM